MNPENGFESGPPRGAVLAGRRVGRHESHGAEFSYVGSAPVVILQLLRIDVLAATQHDDLFDPTGQPEIALGLGIVFAMYRNTESVDLTEVAELRN